MTYSLSTTSGNGDPDSPTFRVLLYSRVSSLHQVQTGHSLDAQPEALSAWAESNSWRVVGEISDPGRTGRNTQRQGFNDLMKAIQSLRPDAVIVTRLSRFMRNARLTLNAVHEMRELGVALICKDEPIDTRQRGISDMFLAILATLAEWESDRLSEYSKETRARLISQGRWPAGNPPFGYKYDKGTGQLVIEPEPAEIVRRIFSLYTERLIGMHSITRELMGIPTPRGGKKWGVSIISLILANSVYAGRHPLGVTAPAIVSQEIFERAQQLRSTNKRMHPPRKDPWSLQNLLRCSLCGSTFRCTYSHKRRVYRCPGGETTSAHYLETGKRCPMPGQRAEELERRLLESLSQALYNPANFAKALEVSISELRAKAVDMERDIGPLQKAREEVEEELCRIEEAWIRGRIGPEKLKEMEKDALERLSHIRARLEALDQGDLAELERTKRILRGAEVALEDVRAAEAANGWPAGPPLPHLFSFAFSQEFGFGANWSPPLPPNWPPDDGVDEGVDEVEDIVYDTLPPASPEWIGRTLREMVTKLQAEVWATSDRMEVRGLIPVSVPSSDGSQAFSSPDRTKLGRPTVLGGAQSPG